MLRGIFRFSVYSIIILFKAFFVILPSILVIFALNASNTIPVEQSRSIIKLHSKEKIHEILPNTRWFHLKPCGVLFDEQKEFEKAKTCANTKVWPDNPMSENIIIPRCFIVGADSPDVFSNSGINFVLIRTLYGTYGSVVGVYQPDTKTVFVIENEDADAVYRHELQHFFLHHQEPDSRGGGHHQGIWDACEPPRYYPSLIVQTKEALKKLKSIEN